MTHLAVTCPACNRSFVVNGRGRCRCGAYLIHHAARSFTLHADRDYYVHENGAWRLLRRRAS